VKGRQCFRNRGFSKKSGEGRKGRSPPKRRGKMEGPASDKQKRGRLRGERKKEQINTSSAFDKRRRDGNSRRSR